MNRRTIIALLAFSVCMFAFAKLIVVAAPPSPSARVDDVIQDLNLTADQQQKVKTALDDLHRKQQKAHDDFVHQLSDVLKADQIRKLSDAVDHSPREGEERNPTAHAAGAIPATAPKGTVIFTGGYDTDPRDHGRPVVLVAAALGVPGDVFRAAFSGVRPAGPGQEPQDEQVRKNKAALMKVLEPYGVTNDKLDAASNAYRYNHSKGEMWPNTPATATAIFANGKVTGIKITDGGAGYSSAPTVSVVGLDDVKFKVKLHFGTDVKTNGSVEAVTVDAAKTP